MGEKIAKFLRGQFVTSIIYILLGAALAFVPVETVNVICKIVFGVMLIASGLFHIILYILEKPTTTVFDLFSGVILVVFGIFLFQNPQIIVKELPILLGGFVLGDCVWTLRGAIRLKKAGSGAWTWLLFETIVFVALGITMIINPFTVIRYMIIFCGAVLLANGVLDLIFQFVLHRGMKNARKRQQEPEDAKTEGQHALGYTAENAAGNADEPVYAEWNSRDTAKETAGTVPEAEPAVSTSPNVAADENSENIKTDPSSDNFGDAEHSGETDQTETASLQPELTLEPQPEENDGE